MAVSIISEQTALKNFAAGKYDREKVFVIAKEPETILHLVESGIELPSLIVGGSLVKEGRRPAHPARLCLRRERPELQGAHRPRRQGDGTVRARRQAVSVADLI